MSHCPSQDWDRYNDEQERSAMEEWIGEIHTMAERLFIANSAQTPEQAYERTMQFMMRRADMDDAMRQPYRTRQMKTKMQPEDRTWADDLVYRFEDLWP
jgi:hypothetical protein